MTAPRIDCERHHAVLSVSDIPRAVEFHTKKLGFTQVRLEKRLAVARKHGIDYDSHASYRFVEKP